MMKKTFLFLATLAAVILFRAEAFAFCWVNTTPVAYGSYNVYSATPTDANGAVRILCLFEPVSSANISISQSGTSGVFNPRQMATSGPSRLNYNLFTNTSYTTVWGDGTGGTATVTRNIGGGFFRATNVTVPGRIGQLQDVGVGSYSDTVTITVNW